MGGEEEFWLERNGYDEDCELLPMREVHLTRIANLAREITSRGGVEKGGRALKRLNLLLERFLSHTKQK